MATFFKRQARKPIPLGAKIKTIRGKRVADWTDGNGQARRAPLTKDGQAILVESETYSAKYFDENGKRRQVATGIADKDGAKQYMAELVRKSKLRKVGLHDKRAETLSAEAQRPLQEHLDAFELKMRTAGRSAKHIERTVNFCRQMAEAASFKTADDVTADAVHKVAGGLSEKWGARSVAARLQAIKSLTRWLWREGKLASDPLAGVKKPNPKTDRKRERRMLLPDEWPWLRSVTLAENVERYGMAAAERCLLYSVAIQTGLRANELRILTRRRLFLDNTRAFITCPGSGTKNRKDARQNIQRDTAAELKQHIATKTPGAPVFAMPGEYDLAKMLRADLQAARVAWIKAAKDDPEDHLRREQSDFLAATSHEGEVLDFHALRHTTGGWLAMEGVHPNIIKTVMRHSVITLTLDQYGHLLPDDTSDAIDKMPCMAGGTAKGMKLADTAG